MTMPKRAHKLVPAALAALAALAIVAAPGAVAGHPVAARLSPGGLDFLEKQLPTYVPKTATIPSYTKELYSCPGDNATFTQRNTTIHTDITSFQLSVPSSGTLRVSLRMDLTGDGEAYLYKPYFCAGETTCQDAIWVDDFGATIDFAVIVNDDGTPTVTVKSVDLDLAEGDIDITFSDCSIDGVANALADAARKWALGIILKKVEDAARDRLAPKLESLIAAFGSYKAVVGSARVQAGLDQIDLGADGITVRADLDVTTPYDPNECLAGPDPGQPPTHGGGAADLANGVDAHVGLAVNFGLIDDLLYHVWYQGLLCISDESLWALGINLDLSHVGDLLPGFPPGTEFDFQANFAAPPRVAASADDDATLTIHIEGAIAELRARLPDGSPDRSFQVTLDARVTAKLILDPTINSLSLDIADVHLDRLEVVDELGVEGLGFDYARIHQLLEERILPKIVLEFAQQPVTGPVFGGMAGYHAILRDLYTTSSTLVAKADLFRAPDDDTGAPNTMIVSAPSGVVRPEEAIVRVTGTDALIPTELLSYVVSVDGTPRPASYVRELKVGEQGRSGTYLVEVAARDLAGNEDGSPATAEVTVDGVVPRIHVLDAPSGQLATPEVTVSWIAEDDLTPAERLVPFVKIFALGSDDGPRLVETIELEPGATTATFTVPGDGGSYRLQIGARDEAGNEGGDAFLVTVPSQGCGCKVAPRSGIPRSGALLVLAGLVLVVIGRRRR